MSKIRAQAERIFDAPPATVWSALTDYAGARAQILPENYLDYHAEPDSGANGVTLVYRLRAGGRERGYHMRVEESRPEHVLTEHDQGSSYTTWWQVERVGSGDHTRVRLISEWESRAKGIGGFFERCFAPLGVRRIHQETLVRLGRLMREHQPAIAGR
ncbi:MAG TPA: SRPBCC family protein [Ktedonobacterales bacterium]